jgi:ferredoxin
MAPTVFRRNDSGLIEVIDLLEYPEEEVNEVIKNCPCNCIMWEDA